MNNEEIMKVYCENTPHIGEDLKSDLLRKAMEQDRLNDEVEKLRLVFQQTKE